MRSALGLLVAAGLVLAWAGDAVAARSIGVARFAFEPGADPSRDPASADLADRLARELSSLSGGRVVAPEALRAEPASLEAPQARDVRRWAAENQVDELVVGRVERGGRRATVELRSGHSGAALASYRLEPQGEAEAELDGAVGRLARRILADLGEDASREGLPGVSAPASGPESGPAAEPAAPSGPLPLSDDEDGMSLVPGMSPDDPISINSEELEVLPQGGGRRLVFSRNVEVHQGDITLEANRLEAIYPQGASQPDRLHATGDVRVAHGDRRGRCDEATYERSENTIVCRGRAEVVQGCDQVRGESIEFDLGRERVRVIGAASVVIQPDDAAEGCAPSGRTAGSAPSTPEPPPAGETR